MTAIDHHIAAHAAIEQCFLTLRYVYRIVVWAFATATQHNMRIGIAFSSYN